MSYQVLARKWRPLVFEDLVGQEPITKILKNAVSTGRIAHAYLFSGSRGVGKTSAARILAKALNCIHGPTPSPCGDCQNCKEITLGNSLSVQEIDGASNRGINEIRELRESIKYLPPQARYRIYIIDEVHMLTLEAFNALLKTLEEPPPHVIFILATTEPQKIPLTVLSRCQRFDFKRIGINDICSRLHYVAKKEDVSISDQGIYLIAREAQGSLRDALYILDQMISFSGKDISDDDVVESLGLVKREVIYSTIEALAKKDASSLLDLVERVYSAGYDLKEYGKELLEMLRNFIIAKIDSKILKDLPQEEIEFIQSQLRHFSLEQLQLLFSNLMEGLEAISRSPFPRFILEMTLIKMAHLMPIIPIEELIEKIDALEGRLIDISAQASEKTVSRTMIHDGSEPGESTPENVHEAEKPMTDHAQNFLNFIKSRDIALGAFLYHAQISFPDEKTIQIEVAPGHFEILKDKKEAMERLGQEFSQGKMKEIKILPSGKLRKKSKGRKAEEEILTNPFIKEAIEIFSGKIEGIKGVN